MKKLYIFLALVFVVLGGLCLWFVLGNEEASDDWEEKLSSLKVTQSSEAEALTSEEPEEISAPIADPDKSESVESEHSEAVIKEATLDFNPLWEINKDVCAWIEIEGTRVDYPVLMGKGEGDEYLDTAFDGSSQKAGSLFVQESYNSSDFNDPVTVIYGHAMSSGAMFGQLRTTYSDPESFASHNDIKIYLPHEVRHYRVFAAVPFEKLHILHNYDFSNNYWYRSFFKRIKNVRAIGANFDLEAFPEAGDRVLILSTCINDGTNRRYLVMASCVEDLSDNGVE